MPPTVLLGRQASERAAGALSGRSGQVRAAVTACGCHAGCAETGSARGRLQGGFLPTRWLFTKPPLTLWSPHCPSSSRARRGPEPLARVAPRVSCIRLVEGGVRVTQAPPPHTHTDTHTRPLLPRVCCPRSHSSAGENTRDSWPWPLSKKAGPCVRASPSLPARAAGTPTGRHPVRGAVGGGSGAAGPWSVRGCV